MSRAAPSKRDLALAQRRAGIEESVGAGTPLAEVASRFGITVSGVRQICFVQGWKRRGDGPVAPGPDDKRLFPRIANAALPGVTAHDISLALDVPLATVERVARGRGLLLSRRLTTAERKALRARSAWVRRLKKRAPRASLASIAARFDAARTRGIAEQLLSSDLTHGEIARRWGVSEQRVRQVWRELKNSIGKPRPRRGRPPGRRTPPTPALRPT